jgi:hypothetical protein
MADGQEGNSGKRGKRRGIAPESDTPFSEQAKIVHGPEAVRAFRCSVYGLVPGVGLLLGPIAFLLGVWAWLRNRNDPQRKGIPMARAAMLLGSLSGLTQWGGLALMILGLQSE